MPKMTDTVQQKAESFHAHLNSSLKAIRENSDLTQDAKRRQIAASYLRAKQSLDGLRDEFNQGSATTAKLMSKDIFGAASTLGADAISVRDAADRASRLTDPSEALGLLQMADENGDEVLARAVAQQSYRQAKQAVFGNDGWGSVLGEFLGSRPEVATKLTEMENAQSDDLEQNFRNEGVFFVVPPTEVGRLSDAALSAMVTETAPA